MERNNPMYRMWGLKDLRYETPIYPNITIGMPRSSRKTDFVEQLMYILSASNNLEKGENKMNKYGYRTISCIREDGDCSQCVELCSRRAARPEDRVVEAYHTFMRTRSSGGEAYIPEIKKVIFNCPATIIYWYDGSKTIVKCQNEAFDPEKGLAMAISKKALGNQGRYCNVFKDHITEDDYLDPNNLLDRLEQFLRRVGS